MARDGSMFTGPGPDDITKMGHETRAQIIAMAAHIHAKLAQPSQLGFAGQIVDGFDDFVRRAECNVVAELVNRSENVSASAAMSYAQQLIAELYEAMMDQLNDLKTQTTRDELETARLGDVMSDEATDRCPDCGVVHWPSRSNPDAN